MTCKSIIKSLLLGVLSFVCFYAVWFLTGLLISLLVIGISKIPVINKFFYKILNFFNNIPRVDVSLIIMWFQCGFSYAIASLIIEKLCKTVKEVILSKIIAGSLIIVLVVFFAIWFRTFDFSYLLSAFVGLIFIFGAIKLLLRKKNNE